METAVIVIENYREDGKNYQRLAVHWTAGDAAFFLPDIL